MEDWLFPKVNNVWRNFIAEVDRKQIDNFRHDDFHLSESNGKFKNLKLT